MSNAEESLRKALQVIQKLKKKVQSLEEPIAIIGVGCRFPGDAGNAEEYWRNLVQGIDCVDRIPESRWDVDAYYDQQPGVVGKFNTRFGAFINDVDHFDADFFGISVQEASTMDPQQRVLAEVAVEALQDAGQVVEDLSATRTGVYIGMGSDKVDYLWMQPRDYSQINKYSGVGNAHNGASGRLSYMFNLQGPSLTIDSACSSSLVALHLAIKALRQGECDLALVGGVSLMLSPLVHVMCGQMQLLSEDGRCKSFSSDADGFGRGEGAGLIIIKRLSDAERDNDKIYAVINGSAVNHNGKSNGLTAPSQLAQEQVMRDAIQSAKGIDPKDVSYIEAHGTGSGIGDAMEIEAIKTVFGASKTDVEQACFLGTVKGNMGHLEAAAGVSSVIKVALALHNRKIPPQINFKSLHSSINLTNSRFSVATEAMDWPAGDAPRAAGVSAFGWSGQNAHIILQEYVKKNQPSDRKRTEDICLLPISAKTDKALIALAKRYLKLLEKNDVDFNSVSYSAAVARDHYPYRICVRGNNGKSAAASLTQLIKEREANDSACDAPKLNHASFVFFNGLDEDFKHSVADLYQRYSVFKDVIDDCNQVLIEKTNVNVCDMILSSKHDQWLSMRPCIVFAFQSALAALLTNWGIRPKAVTGFGVGAITAAYISKILSLSDACDWLLVFEKEKTLPSSKVNHVSIPFISPLNGELVKAFDGVMVMQTTALENQYIVDFLDGVYQRCNHIVQFGCAKGSQNAIETNENPLSIFNRCSPQSDPLLIMLAYLYERGYQVKWRHIYPDKGVLASLPSYPWQRQAFRLDSHIHTCL
ncbi:type I polyketide synthase [Cellvibrio sp. QJXJ]|uniref:type I polyketide synthase n=1 Tax=Cellvibrio sp. QJXJ TaxID=2964606 RepID=UPI0021C47E4E|nr:beta-ketoacyl synthase N-terminal-like domain-containing protein [Cellvibrio sp. QJXJ]UUA73396.1 hypothetical protein NNX04_02845 [Cellvibrio sp. QJXJ]